MTDETSHDHQVTQTAICVQTAEMQQDNSIQVRARMTNSNGLTGNESGTIWPKEESYDKFKSDHKLEKPGDKSTLLFKLIDGKWIIDNRIAD